MDQIETTIRTDRDGTVDAAATRPAS